MCLANICCFLMSKLPMPDQILTVNLSLTIFLNSLGNFHSNLNNKWNNNGGKFE